MFIVTKCTNLDTACVWSVCVCDSKVTDECVSIAMEKGHIYGEEGVCLRLHDMIMPAELHMLQFVNC